MKSKLFLAAGLIYTLLAFSACHPGGAEYVSDLDIVGTAYSKVTDFSARKTYALSPNVLKVGSDNILKPEYLDATSALVITSQIDANMKANGWVKVDTMSNPDVSIINSVMTSTTVYYYSNYWYGYGYGYGWYYPGYYPPTYSTTTTGSLLTQMLDLKDSAVDGRRPMAWVSVVNGLVEGSSSTFANRARRAIDQAFKQSPILKKN